jgi:hypothetical protein
MRKTRPVLLLAMDTLAEVFEENAYFVNIIERNYLSHVLDMVVDQEREVNVAAFNLLRVVVFNSMIACDEMIEKCRILDFLLERLILENRLPASEPYTKRSVEHCTDILCDLLLTRNTKIKKLMFKHHIWQFIY